ncbi:MAG: alpha/beta hydrolase [Alphaproteobacteria bacterium]|jgi:pimeloyl-ACP methyl ester carboxylesterase|nr:alpha/beta hydrolase [Alphaproteobacteria bacterium]
MSLITDVDKFRKQVSPETIVVRGRRWKIIDTGGTGPILLMLPGTLGNADIFFKQMEKLGGRIRIIALGYPLIADVDLLAGDITALLDRLAIPRASVQGTSFGGFLAQAFAERFPGRVETLFIGNSLTDANLIRGAFPPSDVLLHIPPRILRAQMSSQMSNWEASEKIFMELQEFLLRELNTYLAPRAPKLRLAALLLRPKPPVPALPDSQIVIIECQDDPLIPPHVREDVRARYPKAELHSLPTGRHFPYLTRSAAYNEILATRLLAN